MDIYIYIYPVSLLTVLCLLVSIYFKYSQDIQQHKLNLCRWCCISEAFQNKKCPSSTPYKAAIFIKQQNHNLFPLQALRSLVTVRLIATYFQCPLSIILVHSHWQWSALLLPCLLSHCSPAGMLQQLQSLAAVHKHNLPIYSIFPKEGKLLLSSRNPCCAELGVSLWGRMKSEPEQRISSL